jgi:hypothetical protein
MVADETRIDDYSHIFLAVNCSDIFKCIQFHFVYLLLLTTYNLKLGWPADYNCLEIYRKMNTSNW